MPKAVRTPPEMPASALPVSLRAVSVNRTTASAIIGTITSKTKNSRNLARKSTRRQPTSARPIGRPFRAPYPPLPWSGHGAIAQLRKRLETQQREGQSPGSALRKQREQHSAEIAVRCHTQSIGDVALDVADGVDAGCHALSSQ